MIKVEKGGGGLTNLSPVGRGYGWMGDLGIASC